MRNIEQSSGLATRSPGIVQRVRPNESASQDMSHPLRSNHKHMGFQPIDRISKPLENDRDDRGLRQPRQKSAPATNPFGRSSQGLETSTADPSPADKTVPHRTTSLSVGPFLTNPAGKRQKLNTKDTRHNREKGADHKSSDSDIECESPTLVEHISSRSTKRASRSSDDPVLNGPIHSYRAIEDRMRASSNQTRSGLLAKTQKSRAQNESVTHSDDFEMSGMSNGSSEMQKADNVMQYADKPVMLNGDLGLAISEKPPRRFENHSILEKDVHVLSSVKSNSKSLPESGRQLSDSSHPGVAEDDTGAIPREISRSKGTTRPKPLDTPSVQPRSLRDKFRRDYKPHETDEEIDNTDELQQSPPENNGHARLGEALHTTTPKIPEHQILETKHMANRRDDGPEDREKKINSHSNSIAAISRKRPVKEERQISKTGKSSAADEIYPLEEFYMNPKSFKKPLNIRLQRPFFKIEDDDSIVTTINLENFKEVKMCAMDDGKVAYLKGPRDQNMERIVYLVFQEDEHLNWFREKLTHMTNGGIKPKLSIEFKSEAWLVKAFKRQLELSLNPNNSETVGSNRSTRMLRKLFNAQELSSERGTAVNSISQRDTRSQGERNSAKKDWYQNRSEMSPRIRRFRPYTDAIARNNGWKTPLRYPVQAGRQGVVVVEPQELDNLEPEGFLNDSLVLFGLRYMLEMHPESKGRVHWFNTYFYQTLTRNGSGKGIDYEAVKRWTSKQGVDIFKKEYVIVPINQALHWFVAIICNVNNIELRPRQDTRAVDAKQESNFSSGSREVGMEPDLHSDTSLQREYTPKTVESDQVVMETKYSQMSLEANEAGELGFDRNGTPDRQEVRDSVESNELSIDRRNPPAHALKRPSAMGSDGTESQAAQSTNSKMPVILTLDSMGGKHYDVVRNLKSYLVAEALHKNLSDMDLPLGKVAREIPQQPNFWDCGLFLIEYVKRFLDDPDIFVEKVMSGQMDLSYWPHTVAEDLRDDFREIVLQEACKQNGIAPSKPPAHLQNDDYLPSAGSNHQTEPLNLSDPEKGQSSTPRVVVLQDSRGSAKRSEYSSSGLLGSNGFEVRVDKQPSTPRRKSASHDQHDQHELPLTSNMAKKLRSRNESSRQDQNNTKGSVIEVVDDNDEPERPRTRGKKT